MFSRRSLAENSQSTSLIRDILMFFFSFPFRVGAVIRQVPNQPIVFPVSTPYYDLKTVMQTIRFKLALLHDKTDKPEKEMSFRHPVAIRL